MVQLLGRSSKGHRTPSTANPKVVLGSATDLVWGAEARPRSRTQEGSESSRWNPDRTDGP